MTEGDYFAVHLLSEDQADVARLFASKVDDKFEQCESVAGPHGLHLIAGSLATLICRRSFVTTARRSRHRDWNGGGWKRGGPAAAGVLAAGILWTPLAEATAVRMVRSGRWREVLEARHYLLRQQVE